MSSLSGTADSECIPCTDTLSLQDWLYLLFMLILLLLIQWYIVDYCVKRRNLPLEVLVLHLSAAAESLLAAFVVVVIMSDEDKLFTITSCRVVRMSDWYTVFWNPRHVSCTQEAVYPLFSMVFMFYAVSLTLLLLIRPVVVWWTKDKNSKKTIFLSLYVIPGLAFVHSVFCGVICKFSFSSFRPDLTLMPFRFPVSLHHNHWIRDFTGGSYGMPIGSADVSTFQEFDKRRTQCDDSTGSLDAPYTGSHRIDSHEEFCPRCPVPGRRPTSHCLLHHDSQILGSHENPSKLNLWNYYFIYFLFLVDNEL